MPNRILKESICTSDNIGALSAEQEVFFYRLLVNCDDYGRMDARESILLSRCFPLMYSKKTEQDIKNYLKALVKYDLIRVYEADSKPYLQVIKWEKHQTIRNKRSKFPAMDSNCIQLHTDAAEIQSNTNPIPIQYEELPEADFAPSPPVIEIILNDKTMYGVGRNQLREWSALYPNVDIIQELRKMRGWADSNPKKRKTRGGIKRFINNWLSKQQDKGGISSEIIAKPTAFSNFKQPDFDIKAIEARALGKKNN